MIVDVSTWFWMSGTEIITVPQFSYSFSTQRENDYRSGTVKSNMTGYLQMIGVQWNAGWGGNTGGGLSQNFSLRKNDGSTVYSVGISGSSGSQNFDITGLDPAETYYIFCSASSSGGSYMTRNAYGNISYQVEIQT